MRNLGWPRTYYMAQADVGLEAVLLLQPNAGMGVSRHTRLLHWVFKGKITKLGIKVGEMATWLTALAAMPEDPRLRQSIHGGWLITVCNSTLRYHMPVALKTAAHT